MIDIKNFCFKYEDAEREALREISLKFSEGEIILLVGPNGSGKSTLLKSLLGIVPKYTGGAIKGSIHYNHTLVTESSLAELAGKIGFLLQNPKDQVTNLTVEEEIMFGQENLCKNPKEIRSTSEKLLKLMSLEKYKKKSVLFLSGGQLQKLSLASLLAMNPEVLIMDEPLSSLDPNSVTIVVKSLMQIVKFVKLIIISTHWIDPFLEISNRIVFISKGEIVLDKKMEDIFDFVQEFKKNGIQCPQVLEIYKILKDKGIEVNKSFNSKNLLKNNNVQFSPVKTYDPINRNSKPTVILNHVNFTYKNGGYNLKDINTRVYLNTHTVLVGANGSGKSTFAKIVAGLRIPDGGNITFKAKGVGFMFQNPSLIFLETTVFNEVIYNNSLSKDDVLSYLAKFEMLEFKDRSPFTLSEGEKRRLALAIAMVRNPEILILDEPTAGIDEKHVELFGNILKSYRGTLIQITHDSRILGESNLVIGFKNGSILFQKKPEELTGDILKDLGYPNINSTIQLTIDYLEKGFPFIPRSILINENSV